ncbi:MAG: cell envelope integrity protein TolA [Gammaproteobacteria bacterium]|nr:cell envelope integrity protein TolA [Gammaproteobacteria bacterium]
MDAPGREPLGRGRATAYAVGLHVVLLALLFVSLEWDIDSSAYVLRNGPHVIHAYMVGLRPVATAPLKVPQPAPPKAAPQQAQAKQAEQSARLAAAEKAQAEAQAKAKAQAKAQAQAKARAQAQAQALAQAKAQAQAQAQAKARAQAQAKARAQAQARAEAKARAQAQAQAQAQARAEAAAAAARARTLAAQQAAQAQGIIDRYRALIQAKVSAAWVAPPGVHAGLRCTVAVHVIAGGQVLSARITSSSGNAVFDRSVLAAIYNAVPLPVPRSSAKLRYLRRFKFVFTAPVE